MKREQEARRKEDEKKRLAKERAARTRKDKEARLADKKEKEKIVAPATFKKKEEIAQSRKNLPSKPKVNCFKVCMFLLIAITRLQRRRFHLKNMFLINGVVLMPNVLQAVRYLLWCNCYKLTLLHKYQVLVV